MKETKYAYCPKCKMKTFHESLTSTSSKMRTDMYYMNKEPSWETKLYQGFTILKFLFGDSYKCPFCNSINNVGGLFNSD